MCVCIFHNPWVPVVKDQVLESQIYHVRSDWVGLFFHYIAKHQLLDFRGKQDITSLMHKWIIGVVIGLSVIASLTVVKFGLKPKPVPIIKASNFEQPELLATYINRQLYQRLRSANTIILGFNKDNPFEKKVVDTLIELISNETKEKTPQFVLLTPDESYSGSSSTRQTEIRERYGDKIMAFSIFNLKGVEEAPEIINCELDHTYPIWLDCMKKQKVRQINRAKKVVLEKPVGLVESQSQRDILIYIKE